MSLISSAVLAASSHVAAVGAYTFIAFCYCYGPGISAGQRRLTEWQEVCPAFEELAARYGNGTGPDAAGAVSLYGGYHGFGLQAAAGPSGSRHRFSRLAVSQIL